MNTILIILSVILLMIIIFFLYCTFAGKIPSTITGLEIKFNNIIPFHGYFAMMWLGKLYIRNSNKERWDKKVANGQANSTLTHEMYHVRQAVSTLNNWGIFYLSYAFYYIIELLYSFNFDTAYRSIPFEIEAYLKQTNEDWANIPSERKISEWKKYILSLKERKKMVKQYNNSKMSYTEFLKTYFNN